MAIPQMALDKIAEADRTGAADLDLSFNGLTEVPEAITRLTNLTHLNLSGNRLTEVPEAISRLTNLTDLYLGGNRLTEVPEAISRLTNLTRLDLRGNSLNIPPEIISNPYNAPPILAYLRQLQQSPDANRPMNEAKVILVGEAKTGKTSLIKRLTRNDFDPTEPKTDGIDIHCWNLDGVYCTKRDGGKDDASRTVRLNIWDLGGQEIYHATHQFFLTERTLYLLVLSARLTDEQNRLHYWLKMIRALGREAPILIVHNHHETNPEQLDRKTLREKYPTISADGFIETSCPDETLKGIDSLKNAICLQIGKMAHVADPLPSTYFAVKERLEKETAEREFVSGDEYEKICEDAGVTDPVERSSILNLLHALGTVVSFQDDPRLRDTNVLNPEWVTEGVYSVLDDPALKQAGDGLLTDEALTHILNGAKRRYPGDKHRFIKDMMEKFELCFALSDDHRTYLIPELLPKSEPDDIGDFSDALQFELQYDFLPQSVLPRFIVRTSHHLQLYRWRKGVVIQQDNNRALIRADIEANRVTISVAGNERTRRDLLSVIRNDFAQIHKSPETLTVEEQIPLVAFPKARPVPYQFLRELEDGGEDEFNWPGVSTKLKVSHLLSGIERARRPDKPEDITLKEEKKPASPTPPIATAVSRPDLLNQTGILKVASDNERYLNELADKVEKNRVVPFVGAGMTIPLGLPGWMAALERIYQNAEPNLKATEARNYGSAIGKNEVEEAAQVLWDVADLGERWFNDQIKAMFGKRELPPNIGGAIALLPKFARGPVLTTNFDAALEHVYSAAGQGFTREQTVLGDYRADSVINDWDEGQRFLLKLHGDADEGAGRVLTRKQYERAYGEGSKLPELLRALFGSRRPLLFLGCSLLTDRTLIELKKAGLHQTNAYHFALLESPATPEERQKRHNDLIAQYGVQPIWFAQGDFAAIERVLQFLVAVHPSTL